MEEPYKTYKEKNGERILKVFFDECPESPREWSNLGTMICFHRKYALGDKSTLTTGMFDGWEELEKHLWDECDAAIVLPLHLYDHSGITMKVGSFSNLPQGHVEFDTMRVGFIYVSNEKMKEEKLTKEHAEKILRGEVETYDTYLRGNVYRYELVKENKCGECGTVQEELLDSCGGFYGDDMKENGLFDNAGLKSEEWVEG
jgi:hypothetical protein